MSRIALVFVLFLFLFALSQTANAIEWWHDPARGCGDRENWTKTKRISDLPGCDGELPNGAPPGEVAMHDAKRAFRQAEGLLDSGKTGGVDALLEKAVSIMNADPSDPRVNWARSYYVTANSILLKRAHPIPGDGK